MKKYYILCGLSKSLKKWEMLFGDYDKKVVNGEKTNMSGGHDADSWYEFIVFQTGDSQKEIDEFLLNLNSNSVVNALNDCLIMFTE